MANRSDLELALRLKTDLDEARSELQGLAGDLKGVQASTQAAAAAAGNLGAGVSEQNTGVRAATLSVKQYQQAMRQLPMQITDVVTSVASGMPIWMVAIQQGGQLRDSFGGIGPAARAVVGSINPLTVAIAGTAAIAGSLILAFQQGSSEGVAYRESLILTGNAAGTTSDELAAMAAQIDEVSGTQRQAAAALAEVAATGRFTADQIELIGTAAVSMENATGRAISETVAEFIKLADQPSKAAAKLNEQYHFLTASVYEQIRALEDQGDTIGAANLAIEEYGRITVQRATEVTENLGALESAWKGVKDIAAEAWDAMLDIGRESTLDERIAELDERIRQAQSGQRRPGNRVQWVNPDNDVDELETERNKLVLQKEYEAGVARQQGMLAQANEEAIKAQDAIDKLREQSLDKAAKKEKEIAEYRANVERIRLVNPGSAQISEQQIAKDMAAIEKKYADRSRKSLSPEQRLAKQNADWVAQLEKEASTYNQGQAARRQYELDQRGLTGSLRERAEAALKLLDTAEKQKAADAQAQKDAKLLAQLQLDYLRSTGQNVEAAGAEIEKKYGALQQRLLANGDESGAGLVSKLMGIEKAKAELSDLQEVLDRIFAEQGRQEQSINTRQDAGLISEIGARQQILDLNKATADQVEQLLPKMRELAAVTGDPAALERLRDMEARLGSLRTVADEFSNAMKAGFETGLQSALEGLATGTMDLQEAATSFITSIASSMASLASQRLAQQATDLVGGLFGGSEGGGTAQAAAITTASAGGAQAMGTAISAASLQGAQAMAAAITAASTGQATSSAISSAASASGSSSSSGGWMSLFSSAASLFMADGGQVRGPGTGTSDSIPTWLSNNEFVTRAAVVTQDGMLPFLHDLNARGMAALDDWAMKRWTRHSTGGLAGVPAPAAPAPGLANSRLADPAKNFSATLKNDQNFFLVDDPSRIADVAFNSRQGQEALFVAISRDPGKFRSLLEL